jgi:ubiquinone biosynthesis protein
MLKIIFSSRARQIFKITRQYHLSQKLLAPYVSWAKWFNLFNFSRKHKHLERGQALALSLEQLGPIFIKFGQSLSTRPDLFPADIVKALSRLRDQVSPFPTSEAIKSIEQSMGKPISLIFASFEEKPLASASVAQVHGATLLTGENVIVKIIRPGIDLVIKKDIALLRELTARIDKKFKNAKRLRLPELVNEFEHTLSLELNCRSEAANACLLKRNFKDSTIMYVPTMYWDYCHKNMLVSERIYGVTIDDFETLKKRNVNMKKLAQDGVKIFFTQVFRDRFFHADMHAGNIFVNVDDPENPVYCAVDFGIMGSITEDDQYYLAKNLLAFFRGDYETMARLHIQSGWVPNDTNLSHLTCAIRVVCEPIFQKPLKDISFGKLLLQLFEIAGKFEMRMQTQLMLLQKTLLQIEGLGRQIDDTIDLWETALPVLKEWARNRYSIYRLTKKAIKGFPENFQMLVENPELLIEIIKPLKRAWNRVE